MILIHLIQSAKHSKLNLCGKKSQLKGVQKCCISKTCVCLFVFQIAQVGSFSTSFTMPSLGTLSPEKFFPNGHHRDTLTNTYCVLLGKIQII